LSPDSLRKLLVSLLFNLFLLHCTRQESLLWMCSPDSATARES
jgi:hypothetical protein